MQVQRRLRLDRRGKRRAAGPSTGGNAGIGPGRVAAMTSQDSAHCVHATLHSSIASTWLQAVAQSRQIRAHNAQTCSYSGKPASSASAVRRLTISHAISSRKYSGSVWRPPSSSANRIAARIQIRWQRSHASMHGPSSAGSTFGSSSSCWSIMSWTFDLAAAPVRQLQRPCHLLPAPIRRRSRADRASLRPRAATKLVLTRDRTNPAEVARATAALRPCSAMRNLACARALSQQRATP